MLYSLLSEEALQLFYSMYELFVVFFGLSGKVGLFLQTYLTLLFAAEFRGLPGFLVGGRVFKEDRVFVLCVLRVDVLPKVDSTRF